MSPIAVYAGSFDPITYGHLDIAQRAARMFSKVLIVVAHNTSKQPRFDLATRIQLCQQACAHIHNIQVIGCEGLLMDLMREQGAQVLVRGVRNVADFEYEAQIAQVNAMLLPEADTLFLTPKAEHAFISSSIVREVARFGGNLQPLVPACVIQAFAQAD
ncbi:Phosphopantetheine adenylyltransferase [Allopseudospirillum japonicum]|uniref:Phosphopantetheine adenylyltransferase n=1 Tax=Allopseudospirillum japonicum TaxID=64971 RepID=A0A1H6R2A6_9GAMM|nr:pantetheine-phosphate adenylyltransferase [Allopseudospirillum japonicum]SEI49979.1 Phosphopantetheine adenylyltransferase [Allopseudospirillum japonicum]